MGSGFYIAAVFNGPLPFAAVIIIAGIMAFVVALVVGGLSRLRLRGVYFAIFTFALVLLVNNVVLEIERWSRAPGAVRGRPKPTNGLLRHVHSRVVTIAVAFLFRRSHATGSRCRASANTRRRLLTAASTLSRTKVLTFASSAIFMGMAGAIIATRRTYIDPGIAFNLNTSFLPVLMAMFGGMGNLVGPVIGAAVFTVSRRVATHQVPRSVHADLRCGPDPGDHVHAERHSRAWDEWLGAKMRGGRRAPA